MCEVATPTTTATAVTISTITPTTNRRREEGTGALGHSEARAFELVHDRCGDDDGSAGGGVGDLQTGPSLSRVASLYDFEARRLGVRFGPKQLEGRTKRYVHTIGGCAPQRTAPSRSLRKRRFLTCPRRRCVVHVANAMLALAIQAQTDAAPAPDSADAASARRSTLGSIPAPLRTAMGLGTARCE